MLQERVAPIGAFAELWSVLSAESPLCGRPCSPNPEATAFFVRSVEKPQSSSAAIPMAAQLRASIIRA